MKQYHCKRIVWTAVLLLLIWTNLGFCNSLYLSYTEKSEQDLTAETKVLSEKIRETFRVASVDQAQERIDAYDYFSQFKKMLLYGEKLATYARYEDDLKFAKNNELFKGLPNDKDQRQHVKKEFLDDKYTRMSQDVATEVDTYKDLLINCLNDCEMLTVSELSTVADSNFLDGKIKAFLSGGQVYKRYLDKKTGLSAAWPDLAARIQHQVDRWAPRTAQPYDRLIDPEITEAIRHDGNV